MYEKLLEFEQDCKEDLGQIKNSFNEFNIFNVLGIQRREIRHSNFLGWLFDPNETHKLDSIFLKDLLGLVNNAGSLSNEKMGELLEQDLSDTVVHRESENNIDILIINRKLNFVICIENKIDADFSDHQLGKYYNYVESVYSQIKHRSYITLTPFKTFHHVKCVEGENYHNITYSDIVKIIHKNKLEIQKSAKTVIESINQYCTMIEKEITRTNPEVKLAQKLYREHKDAIHFILNNKPDFTGLDEQILKCFNENEITGFISTVKKPFDTIIRILPNNEKLLKLFRHPEFNSWGGDFMFSLEVHVIKEIVFLKWCFGNIENIEREDELFNLKESFFNKMKDFEVFKKSDIYIDFHRDEKVEKLNYPGVCGVTFFNDDEFLSQEKNLTELFKQKFNEINEKLIQPWTEECIHKLSQN